MWGWILDGARWLLGPWLKTPAVPTQEAIQAANAAQAEADGNVALATAKAETAMAQAAVDAPKTPADLESSLDKGTF